MVTKSRSGRKKSMAERVNLLARIAEKAGVDEVMAEEMLANLVGELAVTTGEEPRGPAVELPPYFDRYVTTEILNLKEQIGAFRAEVDRRFTEMDAKMGQRFVGMGDEMDRRFTEVDRRFKEVDQRFDRLERWFLAVGVPIILGILTIIVKIFFSVP
jgi:hypothetical protein